MSPRAVLHALLAIAICVPGLACASAGQDLTRDAASEPAKEWRFRVLLDDKEIGYHHFRLREQAGDLIVDSEASFRVRVLFFDAYRYDHVNRERWGEQCLLEIDATTDVNGETLEVSGTTEGPAFVVETGERTVPIDDCVMTFAYWNPAFLDRSRLLNSQTGDYVDVEIERVGVEEVAVRGENVPATRFRLASEKLDMQLWYSPDREWLGLQSTTAGGRTLRYVLL